MARVNELTHGSSQFKEAVLAALQAIVMTSSALGEEGRNYGWINRELFESKEIKKKVFNKTVDLPIYLHNLSSLDETKLSYFTI